MNSKNPHFPDRVPIDAYGNGGFRFAEARHQGSLLILPSGIHAWSPRNFKEANVMAFKQALAEAAEIDFLLFGTGERREIPAKRLLDAFNKAGMGLEAMDTGAACRTYNVLLVEGRAVAAALLAVD